MLAPKDIPEDRLSTLRDAFGKLNDDKTYKRMMSRMGENIDYLGGADYESMRKDQAVAYKSLVDNITGQ